MLKTGLYEQVINKILDRELAKSDDKLSQTVLIDKGEASKILTQYVSEIIEKGLDYVLDQGGNVHDQIGLINRIISTIISETDEADFGELSVAERAEQLLAFFNKKIVF